MVILSENPYEVPVEQLDRLKVEQLYLNGQPYRKVGSGPVKQIFRGMTSKSHIAVPF